MKSPLRSEGESAPKVIERFQLVPPEARPAVAELLRQISHDLQSPLSALTMDGFSIQLLLKQLTPASGEPSPADRAKAMAGLEAISGNIERASSRVLEYLGLLGSLGAQTPAQVEAQPPADDETR